MRKTTIFALLAALLLGLSLLAGCGSDDDGGGDTLGAEDYETEVNALSSEFNAEFEQAATATTEAATPDAYSEQLGKIDALLEQHLAALEQIEPPAEVADVHVEIIETYSGLRDSFETVRQAADSGDAEQLQEAAATLSEESAEYNDTLNDLVERASERDIDIEQLNQTAVSG